MLGAGLDVPQMHVESHSIIHFRTGFPILRERGRGATGSDSECTVWVTVYQLGMGISSNLVFEYSHYSN